MPWTPRRTLPMLGLTLLAALSAGALPARSAAPLEIRRHPVGWDRIVRPALPKPVAVQGGGVMVPTTLREFPCLEFDNLVADDPAVDIHDRGAALRGAAPDRLTSVSPNVRANDTSADPPGSTQSENTIAANGPNLVAGWNDGKNFGVSPGGTGYGYSINGGLTWTDGGVLPVPSGTALHEGDPCLTVDGAGNFYFSDLYTPDNDVTSAIAVTKGAFSGGVLNWGMPVIVASSTTDFLDKEWIGADKISGNVYCTYTRFLAAGGNQIEFSRSLDGGATWSAPAPLTSPLIESVQGSRVVVGPSGEVQVIYFVYDKASGNNYMRARRSTTSGTSWGPEVTLPTGPNGIFSNYGSGPAGFNRAGGIGFPSLTIDRTGGANNGRAYATWEETVNFYFDPLGTLGAVNEVEGNGSSALANPITIGQAVNGNLATTTDQDWFSFSGTAGQTVILYLIPGNPAGDGFLRLFAGGGATANRTQLSYIGFGTGLCVYTLPYSGTYYFRVLANSANLGNYTVYTGFDSPDPGDEVARDTRDVIIQSSPDGVSWDSRRIVNADAPRFDNAFPEVAVDAAGQVLVDWFDHRGDALGIGTDVYYSRSPTASVSFIGDIKVNDGPPTNWNNVASNLAPNMGDYLALVSDGCNVYANFADGRQGTPDSWVATINDCATPTLVSLVEQHVQMDRVDLRWAVTNGAGVQVSVSRREGSSAWTEMASIRADEAGQLAFSDVAVRPGSRYEYRVGIAGPEGMSYFGDVVVDIPAGEVLAVRSLRNPSADGLTVAFTLPRGEPATLELLDVGGRAIASVRVTGSGSVRLGNGRLAAGIYVVRLTQRGHHVTTKAVVTG